VAEGKLDELKALGPKFICHRIRSVLCGIHYRRNDL